MKSFEYLVSFIFSSLLFLQGVHSQRHYVRSLTNTTAPDSIKSATTSIIQSNLSYHDDDEEDDITDIPRLYEITFNGDTPFFVDDEDDHVMGEGDKAKRAGRKHCYKSNLYCANKARCCTHVNAGEVWCCPRKSRCGRVPNTCRTKSKK
jgi:hypothetical protein